VIVVASDKRQDLEDMEQAKVDKEQAMGRGALLLKARIVAMIDAYFKETG
jgi:hypothetical protein